MQRWAVLLVVVTAACTRDAGPTDGDNLAERCASVAASLERCLGQPQADFLNACQNDPSDETFEAVDQLLASDCVARGDDEGKADGALLPLGPRETFIGLCTTAVISAATVTRVRNSGWVRVEDELAIFLRPFYGELVDDARIYWDATLIDNWKVGDVQLGSAATECMTFGKRIYCDVPADAHFFWRLGDLAHELRHSQQADDEGGLWPFAVAYCEGFWAGGLDYDSNPYEEDAFAFEQRIMAWAQSGGD
jgi:hypothetical protein